MEWLQLLIDPVLRLLKWLWTKLCVKFLPSKVFIIEAINGQGDNIFYLSKSKTPRGRESYFVRLHFRCVVGNLTEVTLVNLDIDNNTQHLCIGKSISIDGESQLIDGNYRLGKSCGLEKNQVVSFTITKKFTCDYAEADNLEHGKVNIIISLASPQWKGARSFERKGELEAGGKLALHGSKQPLLHKITGLFSHKHHKPN